MDQTGLRALAEKMVQANNNGAAAALLDEIYDQGCVSMEGMASPGEQSREFAGLDAIKAKWAWWEENNEIHSASASGPFLHGENQFGIIYEMDTTFKPSGERMQMKELGIYTVENGKVVREEFYY